MMKNNFFQMNNDKPGDGLNHLIDEALHEFSDPPFRDDFTETLLTRLQKKLEWQELILNFSLKIILVLGTLGILTGILYLTYRPQDLPLVANLTGAWKLVVTVASLLFFTFLFDQILLPTLFRKKRPTDNNA